MIKRIIRNKNWKYNIMFIGNKIGVVSNEKWLNYTKGILIDLMAENKEVFIRLKNM